MDFDFNALDHTFFMREALKEAELAMQAGERAIGAVIVHNGKIVGRGRAEHLKKHNRLAHAEMNALLATAASLYDYPHDNAVIYTTLEPCEMCLGAIVMSDAVNHIVFAQADRWINPSVMLDMPHVRRHIHNYVGGVLEEESAALLKQSRPAEYALIRDGRQSHVTPIFLIVGAPAVGKSTTAQALAAQYPKSIHIPVDNLRDMVVAGRAYPGSIWSPELVEQLRLARESAAQMAIRYSNAGFAVTIDDFWDSNSRLLEYQAVLQDARTRKILLCPSQLTAQERNQKRSGAGDGNAYIAAGIQAVYEQLKNALPDLQQQGWLVVDTTGQDVETTVNYLRVEAG